MKSYIGLCPPVRVASWRHRLVRPTLFALCALGLALPPGAAQTITSAVPGFIAYQGKVSNAAGTLVGAGTPVNRTVIFRIWSHQSNSTVSDLVYSEQQTVAISEGEFSVLIGQGSVVTGTPLGYNESAKGPPTTTVATLGVFGGATRYLGVTIDDPSTSADPEISPRQQMVTSAYAFRAKYAESVGSNGVNTITTLDNGNVGIGSSNPAARLDINGAMILNSGINNSATRPPVLAARAPGEIGGYSSSGATSDDGFLRLSAGGGSNGNTKSFIDLSGFSTVGDMDKNILLGTGGTERMRINNSGYVGIANTSPTALLHIGTGANAGPGGLLVNTGWINSSNYAEHRPLDVQIRGTSHLVVNTQGFVGIGTSTPNATLDINGGIMIRNTFNNASARPAVGISRLSAEIGGYSTGGATLDDGFLRLSAGGGTNSNTKTFIDLSGYSSVADMDKNITFGTAGTERMRITNTGNVGIGFSTPDARLIVKSPGGSTGNNTAMFAMGDGGNTSHIHYGTTGDIYWRSSASNGKVVIQDSGGNVGIGTSNPNSKLHVNGTGANINLGFYTYYNGSPAFGAFPLGSYNMPVSIWASGRILTQSEFIVFSDRRIKQVEGRSNATKDLDALMQIEVTDYHYKDRIAQGDAPQKKLIGQQLEEVFPQAVSRTTGVTPDIFKGATVKDGWIELGTNLGKGERVRLLAEGSDEVGEVTEVEPGRFRTTLQPKVDKVFVYGREVKDFRVVDYDAVAMLNVSATQEIKREKDAEIAKLRAENAALAARVATLEAKDQARDTKLASIEKLLQSSQTVMARPAAASRANANGQE